MSYYKVVPETKLYVQLTHLYTMMKEADEKARKVVDSFGKDLRYCSHQQGIAGGISAIECNEKPEGWKSVGDSWQHLYYPKVKEKKLIKEFESLPVIKQSTLNDIIGFTPQTVSNGSGLAFVLIPHVIWGENNIYLSFREGVKYTPHEDMVEILASEFETALAKLKNDE